MPRAPRDWTAIRAAVVGGLSLRAAAAKFAVSFKTLSARSAREGWCVDRRRIEDAARQMSDAEIAEQRKAAALAACESADRAAARIETAAQQLAETLEVRAATLAPGVSASQLRDLAAAIQATAGALHRAHNTRRLALGLDAHDGASEGAAEALLDEALRRLEAEGEIAGPIADIPGK